MKPTAEQLLGITSNADLLKVNAFAGTGKTSMLVAFTQARPKSRILYLTYNKAMQADAQRRFPRNVDCMTIHSLAFRGVGQQYKNKLGNLRPYEISRLLGVSLITARQAIDTVSAFTNSVDSCFCSHHLPTGVSALDASRVLTVSHRLWLAMSNTGCREIPQTHDGYLKIFQLGKPNLSQYDFILLDEGQDSNPVTLDIFLHQQCKKVVVGDRYQSIYGFRNAVNALNTVDADETVFLSQSFRFGEDIATIASGLLKCFFGEPRLIRGISGKRTAFSVNRANSHAIVCRTNAGLFDAAIQSLGRNPIHFVNGADSFPSKNILDAYALSTNKRMEIKSPLIASFQSMSDMEGYAHVVGDSELISLSKIINSYGNRIPSLVSKIEESTSDICHGPATLLTTAHGSKGLEFDQVVLWDDFGSIIDADRGQLIAPVTREEIEEIHLLYVTVTRAKSAIELNSTLNEWLATIAKKPRMAELPSTEFERLVAA